MSNEFVSEDATGSRAHFSGSVTGAAYEYGVKGGAMSCTSLVGGKVLDRTLHVIDVENLIGSGRSREPEIIAMVDLYRRAVKVGVGDLAIIAANQFTALAAKWAWPGALVRATSGPDGADLALLAEIDTIRVAERFRRVVIASGDHAFARHATELRASGLMVDIVTGVGGLSRRLRDSAGTVLHLPRLTPSVGCLG